MPGTNRSRPKKSVASMRKHPDTQPKLVISKDARTPAGMIYLQIVGLIEMGVRTADLSDRNAFSSWLSMICAFTGESVVEYIVDLEHDHLDVLQNLDQSSRTKFSRWVNGKQAPFSLSDRQAVLASALQCLLESAQHNYAFPLHCGKDRSRCTEDVDEFNKVGLGEFDTSILKLTMQTNLNQKALDSSLN